MAPVTEIVYLPLPEGKDPADPATGLRPVLDKSFATILSQPGAQRLFYGQQKENPSIATLFIDWDSVEDHEKFMAADIYKPFMEEVLSLAAGPPSLHHVQFDEHPPSDGLKLGGTTECLNVYFPADYSAEDKATFTTNIAKFIDIVKATTPDAKAAVGGWGVEEVDIPGSDQKGTVYTVLAAWTSVQKHLEYRETSDFKDNIHLLRGAKDVRGVKVFHVSTEEVLKK